MTSRVDVGLAVLALVVASACAATPQLAGAVRNPTLQVGDVRLPDVAAGGEPVTLTAPPGELILVYFGYTSCPDICPTTLSDISVALADLPDELASRVTVALVTVDPARDTDARLVEYLGFFFDRAMALRTADADVLNAAAATFGVRFEVEDHAADDLEYDVAHTAITYVVADTGAVLVEWPFGFEADAMASDMRILLERYPS